VLDGFDLDEIKTKKFQEVMKKLNIDNGLIVVPERNENLEKSSRNVQGFKVISSEGLNVYDVLLHHRLVLLQSCLDQLEKRLLS
jgi:large subunit ribosomal protein L4